MRSQIIQGLISSVALIASALIFQPARGAEISVTDCTTAFVDRITYSVDRTGVIAYLPEEGQMIQAGDLVIRLRDEVARANLAVAAAKAEAVAPILLAKKAAESADVEYRAAQEANRSASTRVAAYPETHMTRLLLNVEAGRLKVQEAEEEQKINELTREQAQAELETFSIYADLKGLVVNRLKHKGEGVQQGEPIVEVVNTDRLRVAGYVSLADSFLIKVGMPVKVTFNLPAAANLPREYTGKLGFIDVSTAAVRDNVVRVWAEIDNSAGHLREKLQATMVILADTPDAAE